MISMMISTMITQTALPGCRTLVPCSLCRSTFCHICFGQKGKKLFFFALDKKVKSSWQCSRWRWLWWCLQQQERSRHVEKQGQRVRSGEPPDTRWRRCRRTSSHNPWQHEKNNIECGGNKVKRNPCCINLFLREKKMALPFNFRTGSFSGGSDHRTYISFDRFMINLFQEFCYWCTYRWEHQDHM